jgi:hypothetical protein
VYFQQACCERKTVNDRTVIYKGAVKENISLVCNSKIRPDKQNGLRFLLPNKYSETFKLLSEVLMKITVVWYVTPCRLVYM